MDAMATLAYTSVWRTSGFSLNLFWGLTHQICPLLTSVSQTRNQETSLRLRAALFLEGTCTQAPPLHVVLVPVHGPEEWAQLGDGPAAPARSADYALKSKWTSVREGSSHTRDRHNEE